MPLYTLAITVVLFVVALWTWRRIDHCADRKAMDSLHSLQPVEPGRFQSETVSALPEPARRFFRYTIAPGTTLYTVADISMTGKFGMGSKEQPNYSDMKATQVLALPAGFVWKMSARKSALRLSGSDSESWTRFWLMGLLPVARMGGNMNHARSAFGRYVAEAVIWSPAALLPGPGIEWTKVNKDCARVTVSHGNLTQAVDLTLAPSGQPIQICFQRWSNANPEKKYQFQPFGASLSSFRLFNGFQLPTHVEAGNHFGTEDYFPFFVADVESIAFPSPPDIVKDDHT